MNLLKSRHFRSTLISLLLPLMLLLISDTALAEVVGKLSRVEGVVDVMPGGQLPAVAAREGGQVQKGDFVRTKSNARAEITFNDGSVIKIAPRSRIDVGEYSASGRKLGLPRGKVQATVVPAAAGSAGRSFEIRTPNAIAGVRGTSFYVYHQANVTGVAVLEGVVHTSSLSQPSKGVTLVAGTATTVTKRNAPTPPRPMTEKELNSHQSDVTPTGKEGGDPASSDTALAGPGDISTLSGDDMSDFPFLDPTLSGPGPSDPGDTPPPPKSIDAPIIPPVPVPPPAPLVFRSQLGGGLMSRDSSINPVSSLLTIINDPGFAPLLSGTTSLWTGSAQASLSGSYPTSTVQPNHYWFGKFFSDSTTSHTTSDGGAYFGYFGGMSLDVPREIDTSLSALYISPTGKIGIMQGALQGTFAAGAITGTGTGPLTLIELNSSSGLNPASLTSDWWNSQTGSTVVEMTGPVLTDSQVGNIRNEAEGFLLDAAFNFTGDMEERGDVLRLGYLAADPSFGIWTRESFGSYASSGSQFVLVSNADWGTLNPDTTFTLDDTIKVISVGNWQSGALTGKADGVWGDLASGSIKLLTGTLTGSSNPATSTFGAVSTGSFIDLTRFLANPTLAGNLGFPTAGVTSSFTLSGTSATGGVSLGNVTFYSRNSSDPVTLWVAQNITGTYSGVLQQQNYSLMDGASPGTSDVMGNMRITSVSSGSNTWMGSINVMGEAGTSTNPFRIDFDGIAAGSFTGTTFTGNAAGLSHPVTYYSEVTGGLRRFSTGSDISYGTVDGIMGGMSLWNSTQNFDSEFQVVGFLTPNQAMNVNDFVLSAPIQSYDIPSGLAETEDGGAYNGHIVAGVSTIGGGPNTPGINGVLNALSIDAAGNAGVLTGKIHGFLDPANNILKMDGEIYPVTIEPATTVIAETLNSAVGVVTVNAPFATGTVFNGTSPALGTLATGGSYIRSYIASSPTWGISQFNVLAPYTSAPASNTPWSIDFVINDSAVPAVKLLGTMAGHLWNTTTGQLAADTRAGWQDMITVNPAATPMTGIFIGETVGTFNPASLQAMTSGIWMETNKFLGLAATTAGRDTLQQLNIPSVEVGSANFSGSNGDFNVSVQNLRFFAPLSGGRPQIFATDSITGNNFTALPTGSATLTAAAGGSTLGISPTFTMNQWDAGNNKWAGTLEFSGAGGAVSGHNNIQFMGPAAGTTSGGVPGTFTGTTAGVVR